MFVILDKKADKVEKEQCKCHHHDADGDRECCGNCEHKNDEE